MTTIVLTINNNNNNNSYRLMDIHQAFFMTVINGYSKVIVRIMRSISIKKVEF